MLPYTYQYHPLDKAYRRLTEKGHPFFKTNPNIYCRPGLYEEILLTYPEHFKEFAKPFDNMLNTKAVNDWLQRNTVFPIVDHFLFVL
jgi:hypothetical protein